MEIRDLRVFVAVVEEGGLSAAARRLHMSQSSLSQIIQSLEKQLGGRLLERDHTGARPTERGSLLLQEARNLVAHHDRVVAEMTDLAARETRRCGSVCHWNFHPTCCPRRSRGSVRSSPTSSSSYAMRAALTNWSRSLSANSTWRCCATAPSIATSTAFSRSRNPWG